MEVNSTVGSVDSTCPGRWFYSLTPGGIFHVTLFYNMQDLKAYGTHPPSHPPLPPSPPPTQTQISQTFAELPIFKSRRSLKSHGYETRTVWFRVWGLGAELLGGEGGGRLQVRHGRGERGGLWRFGLLLCRKWRWRFAWVVVLRG